MATPLNKIDRTALDQLRYRPEPKVKTKRNRDWERDQRRHPDYRQVTFRHWPRALHARIKEIAEEQDMTVSDTAASLMEWAVEQYDAGNCQFVDEEG